MHYMKKKFVTRKERGVFMKPFEKDRFCCRPALALFIILCLAFCGCGKDVEDQALRPSPEPHTKVLTVSPQQTVVAYFLDTRGKNLVPLTMQVNETREVAFVALQKLLAGAPNDFVQSPLPTGIKVKDLYLEQGVICVELTEEFFQTESEQVEAGLRCIVATVGWASPEKQVNILVDGQLVEKIGEKEIAQPLSYTAVNPGDDAVIEGEGAKIVHVYYSDDEAMYLVPVSFAVGADEDVYTFVMKKLVAGPPKNMGLQSTMHQGTALNAVTKEGTLVKIDISKDAVSYGGGTAFEYVFVQSVLTTFAQFPEVETVQILIDGEPYDLLPEGTDIEMPLAVNKTVNYILNQE